MMTKNELRLLLKAGATLVELLEFRPGQECEIFKANSFYLGDEIIYIPDIYLNEIPIDRPITDPEELEDVISHCYTGDDFVDECNGDVEMAERLFWYCDWQNPSAAHGDGVIDEKIDYD